MTAKSGQKDPKTPIVHNNRGISPKNEVSFGAARASGMSAIDSVGVDWLSLTSTNDDVGTEWYRLFGHHKRRFPIFVKDWTHQGGYIGQTCEGLSYGYSVQLGHMLKATGSLGKWLFSAFDAARYAEYRVTRLDVRVDVIVDPKQLNVARSYFERNFDSQRPKYKFVETAAEGGETVYIGSPASLHSARCYDKGAERGTGAGRLWRYEVIFRKPMATEIFNLIKAHREDDDQERELIALVATYYRERNCPPLFDGDTQLLPTIRNPKTTITKKLDWLHKSVRPTVQSLLTGGYANDVFEALGIAIDEWC